MSRATDRKHELLADRALDGLPEPEARELDALGGTDDDSFDLAAAAAALAELERDGDGEALPASVQARILADAGKRARIVGAADGAASPVRPSTTGRDAPLRSGRTDSQGRTDDLRRARAAGPRWDRGRLLGSIITAAAVVIAVFGWLRPPTVIENVRVVEVPAQPPKAPTPAQARAALLAEATDTKTIAWSATPDPAAKGAEGDVVWSASKQQGYMRIRGLAANDPRAQQYQLWIFDGTRDQRYPVDGGVFDVVDGEVVVPIRAPIEVREPKLFAITVEKPGGVVVSNRERIVLTATL